MATTRRTRTSGPSADSCFTPSEAEPNTREGGIYRDSHRQMPAEKYGSETSSIGESGEAHWVGHAKQPFAPATLPAQLVDTTSHSFQAQMIDPPQKPPGRAGPARQGTMEARESLPAASYRHDTGVTPTPSAQSEPITVHAQKQRMQATFELPELPVDIFMYRTAELGKLQYHGGPLESKLERSAMQVYFYSSAGRIVWRYFSQPTQEKLIQKWEAQMNDLQNTQEACTMLGKTLAYLLRVCGHPHVTEDEDSPADHYQGEIAKAVLLEALFGKAQRGTQGAGTVCFEVQEQVNGLLCDNTAPPEIVAEALCLLRIIEPDLQYPIDESSEWKPYLEDLHRCLFQVGFISNHTLVPITQATANREQVFIDLTLKPDGVPDSAQGGMESVNSVHTSRPQATPTSGREFSHPPPRHERVAEDGNVRFKSFVVPANDDSVVEVQSDIQRHVNEMYTAINTVPTDTNDAQAHGINSYTSYIEKEDEATVVEQRTRIAWVAVQAVILQHETGTHDLSSEDILAHTIRDEDFARQIRQQDSGLKLLARLRAVQDVLMYYKLILKDCTEDVRNIRFLVYGPTMEVALKDEQYIDSLNGS